MMTEDLDGLIETVASHTSLGHCKRDRAFVRHVRTMCLHPGGTGAGSSRSPADTAAAHRFAAGGAADLSALRDTRLATALDALPEEETLVVINDVSVLDYSRHRSKSDRRRVGNGRGRGYEYVCSLGLALESERCVGVLHDCLIGVDGPDDTDRIDYHCDPRFEQVSKADPHRLECNHKHALICHFRHISRHVGDRRTVLVADREFDDHFIFTECLSHHRDLVIRSNALRNVQVRSDLPWLPEDRHTAKYAGLPRVPDHVCVGMDTLVELVPVTPFKTIPLDAKSRLADDASAQSHAHVSVGVVPVVLYRKAERNKIRLEPGDYVRLNMVVIKEPNPPEDRDPIQWVLYTTLPTDNPEQIRKIVRIYELRWRIECFFKYLKSGFGLEDLRYDNAGKTAAHLVAVTIAATFLINLRTDAGLAGVGKLTPENHARVRSAAKNPDDPNIDANLRLFALIARQGGWRARKGDPITPMTMIRGFERVTAAAEMLRSSSSLLQLMAEGIGET